MSNKRIGEQLGILDNLHNGRNIQWEPLTLQC